MFEYRFVFKVWFVRFFMSEQDAFYLGFGSLEHHDWMFNSIQIDSGLVSRAREIIFSEDGALPSYGTIGRDFYLFSGGLAVFNDMEEHGDNHAPEIGLYHKTKGGLRSMAARLQFDVPDDFEIIR